MHECFVTFLNKTKSYKNIHNTFTATEQSQIKRSLEWNPLVMSTKHGMSLTNIGNHGNRYMKTPWRRGKNERGISDNGESYSEEERMQEFKNGLSFVPRTNL